MIPYAKQNKGYKYMMTVIDVFSRYAWAVPMKSKSSKDTLEAFKTLFKMSKGRIPRLIQTDQGKEFDKQTSTKLYR